MDDSPYHRGSMSCPSKLLLQWHCFNDGDVGFFMNFNSCDEVTPSNVVGGAQTKYECAPGDVCDCGGSFRPQSNGREW